jgi:voltage-gated sodium channel
MGPPDIASRKSALRGFFSSRTYEVGIVVLILVNAIFMSLETVPSVRDRVGGLLEFVNNAFVLIFVVELALKAFALGHGFWRDRWNWFDLTVVVISLLPASEAFTALRALRALRLLRIVAILPSLRRVVEGFLKAIPSLGSVMGLLVLLLFVFALMGTRMFGADHPELFGSLGKSAFSLFTVMTLEGWPDVARDVMKTHPTAWLFFISFIMLSSWAVLNLVIGVIVDSMQSHTREHEEELEQEIIRNQGRLLGEIEALRHELAEMRRKNNDR